VKTPTHSYSPELFLDSHQQINGCNAVPASNRENLSEFSEVAKAEMVPAWACQIWSNLNWLIHFSCRSSCNESLPPTMILKYSHSNAMALAAIYLLETTSSLKNILFFASQIFQHRNLGSAYQILLNIFLPAWSFNNTTLLYFLVETFERWTCSNHSRFYIVLSAWVF